MSSSAGVSGVIIDIIVIIVNISSLRRQCCTTTCALFHTCSISSLQTYYS
jgi:hypothetical protein